MNWIKYNQPKKIDKRRNDMPRQHPPVQAHPAPRLDSRARRASSWDRNPDVFRLQFARRLAHPPRGVRYDRVQPWQEGRDTLTPETPLATRPRPQPRLYASTPKSPAEAQTAESCGRSGGLPRQGGGGSWTELSPLPASVERSVNTSAGSLLFPDTFPGTSGPTPEPAQFHQLYGAAPAGRHSDPRQQQEHHSEQQLQNHHQPDDGQQQPQQQQRSNQQRRHHHRAEQQQRHHAVPEHPHRSDGQQRKHHPEQRRRHQHNDADRQHQKRTVPECGVCLPDRQRVGREHETLPADRFGRDPDGGRAAATTEGVSDPPAACEERQDLPSTPPVASRSLQDQYNMPTVIRPRPTGAQTEPAPARPPYTDTTGAGPGRRLNDIIEELLYVPINTHHTIELQLADPLYWRAVFPRKRIGLFSPSAEERQKSGARNGGSSTGRVSNSERPATPGSSHGPGGDTGQAATTDARTAHRASSMGSCCGVARSVSEIARQSRQIPVSREPSPEPRDTGPADEPSTTRGRQVFDHEWRLIGDGPLRRHPTAQRLDATFGSPPGGDPLNRTFVVPPSEGPWPPETPRRQVVELTDTAVQTEPLLCCVSVQTSPAAVTSVTAATSP